MAPGFLRSIVNRIELATSELYGRQTRHFRYGQ